MELTYVMNIYCCNCAKGVEARLTDGAEIYPHRPDLQSLPFWKCNQCGEHVGCHHKTRNRTRPLGCIPSPEVKNARKHIHALIDPAWQSGRVERQSIYDHITQEMGRKYHTANIRTIDEAREVYRIASAFLSHNH